MSDLNIKKHPNFVLRKKCEMLNGFGETEKQLASDMATTMYAAGGIGFAAPQVGISKKVIIVDVGKGLLKMVNPKITAKKGSSSLEEGCLSVPEKSINVRRAEEITVSYIDENDKECTKTFHGLTARAIQHEVDHLAGKLIIDYRPWYKRIFSKKGD